MKKLLLAITSAVAFAAAPAQAQLIASDNGGNYGGGWSSGTNGGFGFTAWTISATPGTGFAGAFIGDPTFAGVTRMSAGVTTAVGGHTQKDEGTGQFDISDERSVEQMVSAITEKGYQPVFQDWRPLEI